MKMSLRGTRYSINLMILNEAIKLLNVLYTKHKETSFSVVQKKKQNYLLLFTKYLLLFYVPSISIIYKLRLKSVKIQVPKYKFRITIHTYTLSRFSRRDKNETEFSRNRRDAKLSEINYTELIKLSFVTRFSVRE